MNLPYTMRLICLCCATFFMLHMALAILARLSAGTAIRVAEHLKPRSAARLLFAIRVSPLVLTLLAVLGFCIPSYLWLEPEATGEKVGLLCVLMALLGVALWAPAVKRVMGVVRGTNRYLHECERHGRKITVPGETAPALLVGDKVPVLAVAGVFRPRLLISSDPRSSRPSQSPRCARAGGARHPVRAAYPSGSYDRHSVSCLAPSPNPIWIRRG